MQKVRESHSSNYSVNGMTLQTLIHYKTFRETYKFLKKSQWWSKEHLEEYQMQQLSKLLHHIYENVPYYSKVFDKLTLKPKEIQSIQDLQKLPYLTKNIIKENIEDIKASNYPESKFELSWTGGSTGQPLFFYIEKGVWMAQFMAYARIQMDWANRSFFDRCVFITGNETPLRYQMFRRSLVLSSFYMNDKYIPIFIKKIRKLKPKSIIGYPSAINRLTTYMKRNNLYSFPSVKTVISYAETLYGWQRELLEDMFKCRVFDQYGLRETAAAGSTCEHSNYFHMFPEYGIVELIGKDDKPITKEGEIGEIVGTGFHTHIFPFIRYKTGDLGVYTTKKCKCGRKYPLFERIEGRLQDFIISKTKQLVPLMGVHHMVAESSQNVKECQFYQDTEGEIILNIIKSKSYTDADSQILKNNFQKRFRNEFNLTIREVDHIDLTERGKFQFLIQKLPIDFTP
jgi:phenylacetate-CoA ligase